MEKRKQKRFFNRASSFYIPETQKEDTKAKQQVGGLKSITQAQSGVNGLENSEGVGLI